MKIFGSKSKSGKPGSATKPAPQKNGIHNNNSSNVRGGQSTTTTTTVRTIPLIDPASMPSFAKEKELLKTHIEVCARIRPLQIGSSNESFFGTAHAPSSSSSRKRGLPLFNGVKAVLSHSSSSSKDDFVAWDVSQEGDTAAQSPRTNLIPGRTHSYTLDRVYSTSCTTSDIYQQSAQSLVKRAMEGYHSSVLAYGQTSTGKTFTMTGTKDTPGLIPLAITDCFRYVKEFQEESREYLLRISYLEVYKEHIRDLLAEKPEPVRLFDGKDGLVIRGLKEEVVTSPEEVFRILKQGEKRRQVGATHMNQHSSRSHVMVRLWIESTAPPPSDGASSSAATPKEQGTRVSSLSLVDLAGSESVRLNKGERREEGRYINQSLMTLGQIVMSLSENKTGHLPYRDSKLTRLLQPSLSGNAQMVLLCCISPVASHLEESHNTFKFATRAKKVQQKATINVNNEDQTLLQNYRDEIEELRKQLAEAKEQQRALKEKQRQEEEQAAAAATAAPTTVTTTSPQQENNNNNDDANGEIIELVEAIKVMERLILKSRPRQNELAAKKSTSASFDLDYGNDNDEDDEHVDLLSDDEDKEDDDLLLDDLLDEPQPPRTPPTKQQQEAAADDELSLELSRIRALLGSVLQKRGVAPFESSLPTGPARSIDRKRLDFSTPPRTPAEEKELESLRKQLEEQELTTNLRKADASFLQSQLREKDHLLEEVSKILEAVEKRQSELEQENASLKAEVQALKRRIAA